MQNDKHTDQVGMVRTLRELEAMLGDAMPAHPYVCRVTDDETGDVMFEAMPLSDGFGEWTDPGPFKEITLSEKIGDTWVHVIYDCNLNTHTRFEVRRAGE